MWCLAASVLAWTPLLPPFLARWKEPLITYSVSRSFCEAVQSSLAGDRGVASFGCAQIRSLIRDVLDAWSYLAPLELVFHEVVEGGLIAFGSEDLKPPVLAVTRSGINATSSTSSILYSSINIGNKACWYIDAPFCNHIRTAVGPSYRWVVRSFLAIAAIIAAEELIRRYKTLSIVARTVLLLGAMSAPAMELLVLYPCWNCYSLYSVLLHEVGHAIGLGHADTDPAFCNCGNGARACAPALGAVMQSTEISRAQDVLLQDDANGIRTLYAPAFCDKPMPLYGPEPYITVARIATGIAILSTIAFAFALFARSKQTRT